MLHDCGECSGYRPCPIDDDMRTFYQEFEEADGIVGSCLFWHSDSAAKIGLRQDSSLKETGIQAQGQGGVRDSSRKVRQRQSGEDHRDDPFLDAHTRNDRHRRPKPFRGSCPGACARRPVGKSIRDRLRKQTMRPSGEKPRACKLLGWRLDQALQSPEQ